MLSPAQILQAKATTNPTNTSGAINPSQTFNTPEEAHAWIGTSKPVEQTNPILDALKTYASGVKDTVTSGVDKSAQAVADSASGKINPLSAGADIAKNTSEALVSPITQAIKPLADKVNQTAEPLIKAISDKVGDTKVAQDFVALLDKHPVLTKTITDLAQTGLNMTGVEGAVKAPEAMGDTASKVTEKLTSKGPTEEPIAEPVSLDEKRVSDLYNKSIKPSVAGKTNASQIKQANSQVVTGFKSIAENKGGLKFADENGDVLQGETPKSVDQLSQAIQQTKSTIFDKYDSLAKQAGDKGVTVDAPSIARELTPVIESKALKLANPKAVEYAKGLQSRLEATGELDAKTAQDVIQHYNESLKAFYRNPSYETASNASIDSMVANKFRESLDKGISESTGAQYQDLKNQYGALSSMEKDVARRAQTIAKQSGSGLIGSVSNIASGAELVRGLMTMNPADIASSLTIKGVQTFMKYLNNPDVGVQKIFSEIEKSSPSSKGNMLESATEDTKLRSSDNTTTGEPNTSIGNKPVPKSAKSGQSGKIMNPFAEKVKIPQDDLGTMSDFTSYVAGEYKPSTADGLKLELDASRLAERYNLGQFRTLKGLANAMGKVLEKQNFKK